MVPFITIVIPTFNSEKTIASALISIEQQNFQNYEVRVIDGASNDGTKSIVEEFVKKDNRFHWTSERDNGVYDAMNKGIREAKGDWLYFLGSDDILFGNDILESIFLVGQTKQYDLIYGKVKFKNQNIFNGRETDYFLMLKNKSNIPHQAIFYSKDVFKVIGEYDLKHPVYADFDFNLKCFKNKNLRKLYVDKTMAVFNEEGISKNGADLDDFYSGLLDLYVLEFENPTQLYLDNRRLMKENRVLLNSREYKLGRTLLKPLRKLKKLLNP